jgi:hypothetical protein
MQRGSAMKRWKIWIVVLLVVFFGVLGAGADESELDPLLKLLVGRGLITMEEALAVQAEYDRRRAEEETLTIPPKTPAPASPPE